MAHGVFNGTLASGKAIKNLQVRSIPVSTSKVTGDVQQIAHVASVCDVGSGILLGAIMRAVSSATWAGLCG